MDYEKLMLKIKNKYFPELKDVNVHVKPLWILDIRLLDLISFRPLMWIFDKTIYYNKAAIKRKRYNNKILTGIFAHELAHILQHNRLKLNWFQKIIRLLRGWTSTIFDKKYISKIEKEADRIAIRKGFGKNIMLVRRNNEKTLSKKELDRRRKIYYSPEDLEKFVHSKK